MLSLHSGRVSTGDFGLALRILRNAEIAQWRRLPSGGDYPVVEITEWWNTYDSTLLV